MGIKYNDFSIKGIDVSTYNGVINWTDIPAHFASIRVGYGRSFDTRFNYNWANCKVNKFGYWYLDYYSNWYNTQSPAYGLSDAQWGKEQAENCYKFMGGNEFVALDIESGHSSYSPPITSNSRPKVMARAFLERMDELNGKKNGIYCSLGLLSWFDSWFRDRPLWVAWYPYRTVQGLDASDIIYMVEKQGWRVKPIIWQYASDGDIDDNGTADGKSMGMSETFLDLNAWVGTQEQYRAIFGETIDYADDDAVTTVTEVTLKEYKVIALPYLYIREHPSTSSKKLGLLYNGSRVVISNISDGWGKLYGQPGYVSAAWLK